ncbi:MAG: hypothetical protein MJY87_02540 [Fibrobacter sp.]|nr:hypothetical protein [Fibrobacter sp.]
MESTTRFSNAVRNRLAEIMRNHNVELTGAEVDFIVTPCESVEKMYFKTRGQDGSEEEDC